MSKKILESQLDHVFYLKEALDLEPHELSFINAMRGKMKKYGRPLYGKGNNNPATDYYLSSSKKQKNRFDFIFNNLKKKT